MVVSFQYENYERTIKGGAIPQVFTFKGLEMIFDDNVKLVPFVYNKHFKWASAYGLTDDLLQEGYIGLWKATILFDETKGYAFSTFAIRCIKNEMMLFLRKTKNERDCEITMTILSKNQKREFDFGVESENEIIDNSNNEKICNKLLSACKHKEFIDEYFYKEKKQREIASDYGMQRANVSMHIVKDIKRMRNFAEEHNITIN